MKISKSISLNSSFLAILKVYLNCISGQQPLVIIISIQMKATTIIVIILSILSMSSSVQIQSEGKKHFPNIYGKDQGHSFVQPIEIYSDSIKGQQVIIDYSKATDPKATKVEFMIFFYIGNSLTDDIRYCFIRVENSKDYHYNTIVGWKQSIYWSHYSESFKFETDGTNRLLLSVEKAYEGTLHYIKLYVTGYYF